MRRTRVKICGITSEMALRSAVEAGADAVGFVLAAGSPRTIDLAAAIDLARNVPPWVAPVAVFQQATFETIAAWPHPWVQVHGGDEDPPWITRLATAHPRLSLIRAFAFSPAAAAAWDGCADARALLVDGPAGGSGQSFDADAFDEIRPSIRHPLVIAGGLDAGNVGAVIERWRPWAVDVSSGVESAPGVKDPALIEAFGQAVRAADG